MEKIFEKIKKLIDIKEYHIFINNVIVVSGKSLPSLKKKLKKNLIIQIIILNVLLLELV
jgi:hypothetical protein